MREIFTDPSIEKKFREFGYVVLPCMNEKETQALKEKLVQLQPSDNYKGNQDTLIGQQSFHITFFDTDVNYKQAVYKFLLEKFSPVSHQYLKNYKCAQANVFLKPAGTGFVFPHQNLTIVDEEKFTSVSFWLPLQDTGYENGAVCLIPGSQNNFVKYRNTHVLWPYIDFFKDGPGINYFVPIQVKAGELLIIDDRIIHYTPINTTSKDRWVVHSLWAPEEAQLLFCDPSEKEVKLHKVKDEFWQSHPPGAAIGDSHEFETVPANEKIHSDSELLEIMKQLKDKLGLLA